MMSYKVNFVGGDTMISVCPVRSIYKKGRYAEADKRQVLSLTDFFFPSPASEPPISLWGIPHCGNLL